MKLWRILALKNDTFFCKRFQNWRMINALVMDCNNHCNSEGLLVHMWRILTVKDDLHITFTFVKDCNTEGCLEHLWRIVTLKDDPYYWYLAISILLLGFEGIFTLTIKVRYQMLSKNKFLIINYKNQ